MQVRTIRREIEIDAGADYWCLNAREGRETVATYINAAIIDRARYRCEKADVHLAALQVMYRYEDFGTASDECRNALHQILDEIFGKSAR